MVKFKDFSRPLSVFQVPFNASLIFKDFSRQSCIFKYFSGLCEPCILLDLLNSLQKSNKMTGEVSHLIFTPQTCLINSIKHEHLG